MTLNPLKWFRTEVATSDESIKELFNIKSTSSGVNVNQKNAMQISTVFSCVRVLSEGIASLPLHLYKQQNNKKSKATSHDLYEILNLQPNSEITSMNFWEMAVAYLALNGNFYAQIIRTRAGRVKELIPLVSNNVTKYRLTDGTIIFTYYSSGKTYEFKKEDIFEVMGLTLDGFTGVSAITYQRESLGLGKAAEEYGAKFFKNDATPPIAVTIPGELSEEAYNRLKKSWQKAHGGDNAHKTALLEGGSTVTKIGLSNADSQFLETRKYQRTEIAGMFRVPPHLIGDLEKSSFSNISEQSQELVKYTLHPYIIRIERAIQTQLLNATERKTHYPKFNVDGLLRGDIKTRYEAYNIGRNMGVLSANEIRSKEEMNPIANGDIYLTPLNMSEAGKEQDA